MNSLQYIDRILKDEPANNPPYLTRRGSLAVLGVIVFLGATVWAYATKHMETASLLSAIAGTGCFLLALCYARNLLIWRSIQLGHFSCSASVDKDTLYPGAQFLTVLTLDNALPFSLHIAAIRWDHTQNIEIAAPPETVKVAGHSDSMLECAGKAMAIGHAHVLGTALILSDDTDFFRMEVHIELDHTIRVLPQRPTRRGTLRRDNPLLWAIQRRIRHGETGGDPETIRPWQSSDSIRRVLWRGFAKHLDIQTVERARHPERSIVCLIDGGDYMRLTRPDKSCNLADCAGFLSEVMSLFESVTIISYDATHARNITSRLTPEASFDRLEKWILDELDWRPPAKNDAHFKEIWSLAATRLYRDFKIYKGVDFSKKGGNGSKIDLYGLVQWATADMASKALAEDRAGEAAWLLKSPYEKRLVALVRERCRMPHAALLPDCPAPDLQHALPLIKRAIQREQADTFIWFSDFAMPLDDPAIRSISGLLRATGTAALAVCMPMPVHALNFNRRRGEFCRERNRHKLGKQFETLDMTHDRPKTSTARVLRTQ